MAFTLIPPFRVNYTFSDLLHAAFIKESSTKWSNLCVDILSRFFKNENISLTSSGRNGLYIILRSLPQSKVFVPAYTCPVVIEAIRLSEKKIVFVKTSATTFNADIFSGVDDNSIVIATHQYGNPCDIVAIAKFCKEKKAVLIEDCAAALGSTINERLAGTFGDFAIFSFNSTKLLNAPSMGGFIICKERVDLIRIIKGCKYDSSSGLFKVKQFIRSTVFCLAKNRFIYPIIYHLYIKKTINNHTDILESIDNSIEETYRHPFYDWQAKVLYKQLKMLPQIIKERKELFDYFDKRLNSSLFRKPIINSEATCCRYTIRVKNREVFYKQCVNKGVDMDFSFNHIICPDDFHEERMIADEILNIPFYVGMKESERAYIVDTLNSIRI